VAELVGAASKLKIIRRAGLDRWSHLSLCVLDAVFSIGANYRGVVRVCQEYARHAGLSVYVVPHRDLGSVIATGAEQRLDAFVTDVSAVGVEEFAKSVVHHRGRTSTQQGILKADAALRYAEVLLGHGVRGLADVHAMLADPTWLGDVERDMRRVPGNGRFDIRLGYLWMLTGDDHRVKVDRMVVRWLARHLHRSVDPPEASVLIAATAQALGHTPWELDHAIWRAASGRSPNPGR
jgi:hypothetical protein